MDTRQKSENAFKEFLDLVNKLTNDDKEIHHMLQKSYDRTNPHFRWSRGFINLVTLCGDKIREVPEKRLLHIREFVVELSHYKAKPLKHLLAGASHISDSDDSSLDDAPPPAKKPNLEAVKASSVGEVGSLSDQQHTSVSNGRKGDEVQTAVSNGAVANQGEKRKTSSLSDKTVKVSEGTNDSDNSECQNKKRWFYNSATVKKSPDDSLPLLGYVRNIHNVSQSVKEKINSSDIICLDDDDDDDDDGRTRVTDQKYDYDGVESDVEGETEKTSSGLNFSSTKSDSKLTSLNSIKTSKSGASSIPKKSNIINNKVPHNEIEVICLDDDDDDDDDEVKEPVKPLLKYRYPVRKLIENSSLLPVKTIADLGVIEIIDIDEKQCEDKTMEIQSIPSIRSKPKVWDKSDNVKTSQQADVASDTSAKDEHSKAVLDADDDEINDSKCENEYGNADDENGGEAFSGGDDEEDKEVEDEEILKQVKHLICVLKRLGREIQKLELTEMTLDDMNSEESAFIKESELRSKFVESWTMLCDLTGTKFTSRACNKRFAMKIPDYPEIGRQISEFINEGKVFPDFQDIYDIVVSHNGNCSLFLTESAIHDISNKIFTSVGNKIQQHRKMELFKRMKSYLQDDIQSSDDPALFDTDLCQKLEENQSIAYEKLQLVFMEFSEKQDAGCDEAAVSEDDDDDDDDDDISDNDSNDGDENNEDKKESVEEAEIHGSGSCVDQSAEAIEPSSITELPSLCVGAMYKDVDLPKQEAETMDGSYSEDGGDDDDDDDNAKTSVSDEEDDDDILIITFDDVPVSHKSSVCKAVVISDDQTANESSITNQLQNSANLTRRVEMSDSSQFKIQSDLLDNIRRLTSNITFLSNNAVLGAADNKDNRSDRESGLECISAAASPPKILEVEFGESDEPTKSDRASAEISLKQPIFDGNINTTQVESADKIDDTPSEQWTTLTASAKEVEPENLELLNSRESDTCDNLPSNCSSAVNTTEVTSKDSSTVLETTVDYKTLPVTDDRIELTIEPCGEMQTVPDDLPELSTAGALSVSAPALIISPDFLLVQDVASLVQPTSLPCFDVGNSVSKELPVHLADDEVKPVADLTCTTDSLDCEMSPLGICTSDAINDVPVDKCSSSDLDLRPESPCENPEALAVSSDHSISNVVSGVPADTCLSSDLELQLELLPESAETVQQQQPLDINPDKFKQLDAANDETKDILLEKP